MLRWSHVPGAEFGMFQATDGESESTSQLEYGVGRHYDTVRFARGLAEVEIFSRATLGRGEGGRYIDLNYCECSRKTDGVIESPDPMFQLRSALRFPIRGPEHAELGPRDVRPYRCRVNNNRSA